MSKMAFRYGRKSMKQRRLLHPRFQKVLDRAIILTEQDYAIHVGARTAQEQNRLYQQGRSRPGKRVTSKDGYRNKSNHQIGSNGYGNAVDLVPWHNNKLVWDWELIYPIAVAMSKAAREVGAEIRWGGNWYDAMDEYPATIDGVKAAVERYKVQHPGDDFIDGPHFEYLGKA